MKKKIFAFICIAFVYGSLAMGMTVTSTAFRNEENIPIPYTCDGKDIAPALAWSQAPKRTESFALILEDPDAPAGVWTHWVLFNIPHNIYQLTANTVPEGAITGKNSWGNRQYNGPCPPYNSTHRYNFKLYALDTKITLAAGASAAEVKDAIKQHILGQGELMGKYQRSH